MTKKHTFLFITFINLILLTNCNGQTKENATKQLELTNEIKTSTINNFITELNSNYIFLNFIPNMAKNLDKFVSSESTKSITNPNVFADSITSVLQQNVLDKHLGIKYKPNYSIEDKPQQRPRMRPREPQNKNNPNNQLENEQNGEPVEFRLIDGNIGLLKLDIFDDQEIFYNKLNEAFGLFTKTKALIIDLRNCGGGSPKAENYVISHFFKIGTQFSSIFTRKGESELEEKFYAINVNNKYLDNPIYILTGDRTFSSAENFAYDMQSLKRAKIVGVKTKGGANPGREFSLGNSFFAFIPTGRSYSYVTKTNWEGVGIQPDFLTKENALTETTKIIKK